jgi:YidC/Oxa1 family membrane protein insertase
MEWIYKLLPSYGWDIIIFTLLINIVKIPLQLSQQKSMAKMSAFQPMMMEIQTKYKDKPEKQQEEMLKLQQDYGYSPTAGCVPMLLNFLVMFGVIGVVYNPLERIFHISAAALTAAGEALTASGVAFTAITRDTNIIAQVVAGNGGVLGCFSAEQIATITEFSQHMNFLGIDLTRIPKLGLSLDIVLPLLSVITMLLHEGQRPADAGQHEADHVYDAADVPVLLLHLSSGILSVLRHFQHRDDRADSGHAQGVRPR